LRPLGLDCSAVGFCEVATRKKKPPRDFADNFPARTVHYPIATRCSQRSSLRGSSILTAALLAEAAPSGLQQRLIRVKLPAFPGMFSFVAGHAQIAVIDQPGQRHARRFAASAPRYLREGLVCCSCPSQHVPSARAAKQRQHRFDSGYRRDQDGSHAACVEYREVMR
jgi:hypothetical protein